jgi:hypothetical protein
MLCPKCGHQQAGLVECERCGVIFAKIQPEEEKSERELELERRTFGDPLDYLLNQTNALTIDQDPRGWLEILLNWEVANEYSVHDGMGRIRGSVVEQGRGFGAALRRTLLGSHRPLHLAVFSSTEREIVLELQRSFFWLLSEMQVTAGSRRIGTIIRRFTFIRSTYELRDQHGTPFATIIRPVFGIWTFPIYGMDGQQRGEIVKKWSGLQREYLTDADKFRVSFGDGQWTLNQRAVIFAAALSIDFDLFENNRKRS